ncbi:hypothetical protein [Ochrobactrum chromiisoli]|uniref:Uncharacterized protein n=1 Tax=Ochrobactrum chromiisoli TaxID=2993941 RepID=A0ABT3QN95_9HYPH|nr:hypothetical protein [Ochrobactrum chromiisoli]MCX2697080.1 hypothetical protein [Ochrobactrum chromiisoli]
MANHAGVTTENIDPMTLADEIIVNRGKRTGRLPVANFSQQLASEGMVASLLSEKATKSEIEALESVAYVNAAVYETVVAGLAATANGQQFQVQEGKFIVRYRNNGGGAVEVQRSLRLAENSVPPDYVENTFVPAKNLVDSTKIRRGRYFSNAAGGISGSSSYRCTGFIPVKPGQTIAVSGAMNTTAVVAFQSAQDTGAAFTHLGNTSFGQGVFVIPADRHFLVVNVTNAGQDNLAYDATLQVEIGNAPTAYEPYNLIVRDSRLPLLLRPDEVIELISFNMIDLAKVSFVQRYSASGLVMVNDTSGIASTAHIAVEEGKLYAVSGSFYSNANGMQGGYFVGSGTQAIANIVFGSPPSGSGQFFQVPTGLGITHVVLNLWKEGRVSSSTTLEGNVQMERGEIATDWRPYSLFQRIKPALIDGNPTPTPGGGSFNVSAWYQFVEADEGSSHIEKLPKFRKAWLEKKADLCVVNTGTSLTARSTEHCTDHPKAPLRPPLMHSRNFASHIWDRLCWQGQQYRRYDASGVFTETGTWATSFNLAEWDDGAYRHGLTRYSSAVSASVSFGVPVGAWQYNFIYRTDSKGCTASVTIDAGNGKMQVFDQATQSWIEANGYSFSMNEPAPVTRNVNYPHPSTGTISVINVASKGNTTYQKRLKMRCRGGVVDSLAEAKIVTIARTGGGERLMYWGVEWSPRQYMITYINAARGSHNTQANSERGLPRFQDNEVWSFKPDLFFSELPITNDGAGGSGQYAGNFWSGLTENFIFKSSYELSLTARATHFGLAPEFAFFTTSYGWNGGGVADDGQLSFSIQNDGTAMSPLDKMTQAYQHVVENHPTAVIVNLAQRWTDAGFAIFGEMRTPTEGSGKAGSSFTNDGTHWNDTGSRIQAKGALAVLNFTK